ncbi:hypothetical protein PHYPSEUDO_001242 [Phytophthora pseudosyringae]|uniref:PH domain-containing protein n=1 Tax=Phytophthora pseudosyringae TaxID=221518 RepID=A0A8T1W091_9STRA|nr:hypothetical protein PHYPSEUDO_001242 [Phytophthora pseudosyringae]
MENLRCADFKLQCCPLVWRHVHLRLSHEQHWATRLDVPILSVTRRRRRPLSSRDDRVLVDQIALDSSTRLLPSTSRDLRRLRFSLQHGDKHSHFQAPDEAAYEKWRVAIVGAIDSAEKAEQKWQAGSNGLEKDDALKRFDRDHFNAYARDATNRKLIRLHQPAAVVAAAEQLPDMQSDLIEVDSAFDDDLGQHCDAIGDVTARKAMEFSQLFDAVEYECKVISSCVAVTTRTSSAASARFGYLSEVFKHKFEINMGVSSDANQRVVCRTMGSLQFGHLVGAIEHQYCGLMPSRADANNASATFSEEVEGFCSLAGAFKPWSCASVAPANEFDHQDCVANVSSAVELDHLSNASHHVGNLDKIVFGHLVDAMDQSRSYPGSQATATCMPNSQRPIICGGFARDAPNDNGEPRTVINIEKHDDAELDNASTVTVTTSDDEDEWLAPLTPKLGKLGRSGMLELPLKQWRKSRQPTARETLRRRLMETDTRKHGMLPYHSPASPLKQPEEELEGMFDRRWLGSSCGSVPRRTPTIPRNQHNKAFRSRIEHNRSTC